MNMTQTTHYRVIEITTNDFGTYNHGLPSKVDETTKWSGTNLDELSRKYPPSNIFGADPLGHSEIEDGLIRMNYRFERQTEDGSWERIDDPRRRITPMTSLEREIDAENRRDFPGDYITSDCERCGDYGCDECEDPDRVDCKYCADHGCNMCDPTPEFDCEDCEDHGCSTCDPEAFPPEDPCNDCGRFFEVKLLTKEGLCTQCENYRIEESKPRCIDCDTMSVDNAGEICSDCQRWRDEEAKPRCCSCSQVHTDPKLEDSDLCKDCDDYVTSYYVWWRRVLRRLRLMK